MTILTICTIIAAILYLGSGMAIIGSMKGEGSGASSLIRWPVLAGLVMQGYALHGEMFGEGAVNFGFGFAMSEMFFFAVIILLIETWIHRLHGQFGIVLIAAAVGTLSPLLFTGQVIPSVEWTTIFRWHLLLAIAAYAFLIVVSLCRIDRTVADLNGIRNATLALLGSHLIDAVTQNGHLDAVV